MTTYCDSLDSSAQCCTQRMAPQAHFPDVGKVKDCVSSFLPPSPTTPPPGAVCIWDVQSLSVNSLDPPQAQRGSEAPREGGGDWLTSERV